MATSMKEKVALVTGAASGIGRGVALVFAREGAKVVIADINLVGGRETVEIIQGRGGTALFVETDVSQSSQVERLIQKVVEVYGRLDYACNNAGIPGIRVPMIEFPEDQWNFVVDTDLKSVWLCMKYEIPLMLKQGKGAIVNISSAAGLKPNRGSTAYSAAKHGVIGLTKMAALEHVETGIRVNTICPGAIRTPLMEDLIKKHPEREAWYLATTPMKRLGTPGEIGEAVIWLCSDAASFITGVTLPIDGGYAALG